MFVIGLFVSCQQSINTTIVKAPVDSLVANWNDSWNNHDSISVRNLFVENAILTDDNIIATNLEEISTKMIHPYINVVNNLKTKKLQEWSTNDRAGYTGTYEFEVIVNDALVANPKGVFILNWIKTDKDEWKITTAVLYSFVEQK
jgi:hypothetical protein